MAKRTKSKGEVLYEQLLDKHGGDLGEATVWELRAAMQHLRGNHRYYKALEGLYWDKTWSIWHGLENEPAPAEL